MKTGFGPPNDHPWLRRARRRLKLWFFENRWLIIQTGIVALTCILIVMSILLLSFMGVLAAATSAG